MNNNEPIDEFNKLLDGKPATAEDKLIQELQESLTEIRDARKEDSFIFIFVSVILLDIVFFSVMPNSAGPIVLFVLELLILIPLARKLGVEQIVELMDRVLSRMIGGLKSGN